MLTLVVAAVPGGAAVGAQTAVPSIAPNVLVNRPGVIDANNSPTLVRNPKRTGNVVVVHRVDRPRFSATLEWSRDGGRTWTPTALPLPAGKDRPYAPDAAFAPDGTLYVLYANLEGQGNDPENLWMASSPDGGRTLSPPSRVTGRYAFQARLAVDRAGDVVVTWLQADGVGTLSFRGTTRVVASRSTDGGRHFSAPVQVSDPDRVRVGAATPLFPDGKRLVVLYEDFRNDTRDFENLDGPAWDQPFALVLGSSDDGGRSFGPGVVVDAGLLPAHRFLVYLPDFPSLAAGPGGNLLVAWSDARSGGEDVYLRRSSDGGRQWQPLVRIDPDQGGESHYLPHVAVSPGGRVDVVLYQRDATGASMNTVLASSAAGSGTFRAQQVSSASFDARVGPVTTAFLGVDFGSRLGLVSTGHSALAVWTDTRFGSDATGRQDIVAGTVAFGSGRGSHVGLGFAIAAGVGLLALTGWIVTRRVRTG